MHIIGNGVDIIKNSRINNSLKNKGFLNRIFTEKEIQQGKWRFLGSKEDTQQDISNRNPLDIKKYKENIEHYLENL